MRVLNLKAENFKRLTAVDITPDGDLVIVSGRNGQGKSSIIDGMWAALCGRVGAKDLIDPVRHGAENATVELDLGDLRVTRRWKPDGSTTLKVSNAEGHPYSSPQKVLDQFIGQMTFDPLAFTKLHAKDQLATLLDLVELPFDPEELAERRQGIFNLRTDVNRDLKAAEARLAVMPEPAVDLPAEEVPAAAVLEQLDVARATNARHEATRAAAGNAERITADHADKVKQLQEQLAVAQVLHAQAVETQAEHAAAVRDLPGDIDVEQITRTLAGLDETNAAVRAAHARDVLTNEVGALRAKSDELTGQIDALDAGKQDALEQARMPIQGLAFNDDGVTYRDVPFVQCSAAEKLRIATAIGMASNPDVRVLRITDGSLLDSNSMRILEELCAAHDFQAWVEVVDESGELGVVIEDGSVARIEASTAA